MEKEKELVVLKDDEIAAKKMTVAGWVSRNGRFYGSDERTARHDGSTHNKCECGNKVTKGWTKCDFCISKSAVERYKAYTFQEWDGKQPVYSENYSKYFYNIDEIDDFCEDSEVDPKDLMLVICDSNYLDKIDSSIWEDKLPEDGDIPKELQDKLDELNQFIKTLPAISYSPSKIRTEYKIENK
mgnify:FL=1